MEKGRLEELAVELEMLAQAAERVKANGYTVGDLRVLATVLAAVLETEEENGLEMPGLPPVTGTVEYIGTPPGHVARVAVKPVPTAGAAGKLA